MNGSVPEGYADFALLHNMGVDKLSARQSVSPSSFHIASTGFTL
jgi:hypothetical protein